MKIQLREVKYPAQSHTAEKQQGLNLNLGLADTKMFPISLSMQYVSQIGQSVIFFFFFHKRDVLARGKQHKQDRNLFLSHI